MTEEKSSHENSSTLDLLVLRSKKGSKKKKGRGAPGGKDYIVYELYGQYFRRPKKIWVQQYHQNPQPGIFNLNLGNLNPNLGNLNPNLGNLNPNLGNLTTNFGNPNFNLNQNFGNLNQNFGNLNQNFGNLNPIFGNPNADPNDNASADPEVTGPEPEEDPKARNRFVFKVFSIVLVMILLTMVFNFIVHVTPGLYRFFRSPKGKIVAFVCGLGQTGISFLTCLVPSSNYPPLNYVILLATLIFMTGITVCLTAVTRTTLVLYALAATLCVVLVILALACSKWDFTKWSTFIIVAATAFGVISMLVMVGMAITKAKIPGLWLAITIIGTLIESVILVLSLQTIIGKKSEVMSQDLYIIAAYDVYSSIISIFMKLVLIFRELMGNSGGGRSDDDEYY